MNSDIIAGLALLVSIIVFGRQIVRDRRQDKLDKEQRRLATEQTDIALKLAEIEEQRRIEEVEEKQSANVVPQLVKNRNRVVLRLLLRNSGPAEASDVEVELKGIRGGSEEVSLSFRETLPINCLQVHQTFELHVAKLSANIGPPYVLVLRWTDGRGPQSRSHTLSPTLVE